MFSSRLQLLCVCDPGSENGNGEVGVDGLGFRVCRGFP